MCYDNSSYVDLLRRKHRPEDKGLHWWEDNWLRKSSCDDNISSSGNDDVLIRCLLADGCSLSLLSLSMESNESRILDYNKNITKYINWLVWKIITSYGPIISRFASAVAGICLKFPCLVLLFIPASDRFEEFTLSYNISKIKLLMSKWKEA